MRAATTVIIKIDGRPTAASLGIQTSLNCAGTANCCRAIKPLNAVEMSRPPVAALSVTTDAQSKSHSHHSHCHSPANNPFVKHCFHCLSSYRNRPRQHHLSTCTLRVSSFGRRVKFGTANTATSVKSEAQLTLPLPSSASVASESMNLVDFRSIDPLMHRVGKSKQPALKSICHRAVESLNPTVKSLQLVTVESKPPAVDSNWCQAIKSLIPIAHKCIGISANTWMRTVDSVFESHAVASRWHRATL